MSSVTTAAAVLDVLAQAGVSTAFGLPGVHNLALWQAQDDGRPRIVGVRHEQTTGYAADGLARATGGLGVALTTTGPGAANAVAAFGEAAASQSPLLLIASDVPQRLRRPGVVRGLLHESRDQAALFEPLAKAVYRPTTPIAAVEAVARAAALAMTAPRGPVYVGIPSDVLAEPIPDGWTPPAPHPAAPAAPDPADVDAALRLLNAADSVVVWAGGGAVASGAAEAVTELAWRLGAPVVTTYAARGLLPAGHALLVDAPPHEPDVAALIGSADLLVVIGSDLDGMDTRNWSTPFPARTIAINVDPADAVKNHPADVVLAADARLACDALAVRLRQRTPWADAVFLMGPAIRSRVADDPRTADAAALLESVEAAWPAHGNVLCDMAVAGYWVGGYAAMSRPRRLQYPVGWGTLGYALPAAVGAAHAGAPVLAICGDGGLAMALGELATLVQERLPVTVLVVDDGGYGMLRFDQRNATRQQGVDLVGPDWAALGAAFGLPVVTVGSPGEPLRAALAEAAAAGGPRLVVLPAALYPPRTTSPRWGDA